ncbi:hypothetical protein BCR33DRAFT_736662 [Rhizoclosmatium globosum]|uniref:Uncharacterized protein n=1 Tax=Rhizoclosmatium globosum TaxID=329046 RepID=A0A1Y2CHJ9_9FUNG|nr:hypothetical protein BCR33DRAFT_736662 [Rhizoclosmatium globosum]|eukprot:ORY46482.1 hypothetical protein BCR33DRAFT_736662 [Rhizoclosmatium globosum]
MNSAFTLILLTLTAPLSRALPTGSSGKSSVTQPLDPILMKAVLPPVATSEDSQDGVPFGGFYCAGYNELYQVTYLDAKGTLGWQLVNTCLEPTVCKVDLLQGFVGCMIGSRPSPASAVTTVLDSRPALPSLVSTAVGKSKSSTKVPFLP